MASSAGTSKKRPRGEDVWAGLTDEQKEKVWKTITPEHKASFEKYGPGSYGLGDYNKKGIKKNKWKKEQARTGDTCFCDILERKPESASYSVHWRWAKNAIPDAIAQKFPQLDKNVQGSWQLASGDDSISDVHVACFDFFFTRDQLIWTGAKHQLATFKPEHWRKFAKLRNKRRKEQGKTYTNLYTKLPYESSSKSQKKTPTKKQKTKPAVNLSWRTKPSTSEGNSEVWPVDASNNYRIHAVKYVGKISASFKVDLKVWENIGWDGEFGNQIALKQIGKGWKVICAPFEKEVDTIPGPDDLDCGTHLFPLKSEKPPKTSLPLNLYPVRRVAVSNSGTLVFDLGISGWYLLTAKSHESPSPNKNGPRPIDDMIPSPSSKKGKVDDSAALCDPDAEVLIVKGGLSKEQRKRKSSEKKRAKNKKKKGNASAPFVDPVLFPDKKHIEPLSLTFSPQTPIKVPNHTLPGIRQHWCICKQTFDCKLVISCYVHNTPCDCEYCPECEALTASPPTPSSEAKMAQGQTPDTPPPASRPVLMAQGHTRDTPPAPSGPVLNQTTIAKAKMAQGQTPDTPPAPSGPVLNQQAEAKANMAQGQQTPDTPPAPTGPVLNQRPPIVIEPMPQGQIQSSNLQPSFGDPGSRSPTPEYEPPTPSSPGFSLSFQPQTNVHTPVDNGATSLQLEIDSPIYGSTPGSPVPKRHFKGSDACTWVLDQLLVDVLSKLTLTLPTDEIKAIAISPYVYSPPATKWRIQFSGRPIWWKLEVSRKAVDMKEIKSVQGSNGIFFGFRPCHNREAKKSVIELRNLGGVDSIGCYIDDVDSSLSICVSDSKRDKFYVVNVHKESSLFTEMDFDDTLDVSSSPSSFSSSSSSSSSSLLLFLFL